MKKLKLRAVLITSLGLYLAQQYGTSYLFAVSTEDNKTATPDENILHIEDLIKNGKYEEALPDLTKILENDPNDRIAELLIARVLFLKGSFKEAAHYVESVLVYDPKNTEILLIKANILDKFQHSKDAILIYEEILSREELFEARYGLSLAYLHLGDLAKAEENLKKLKATFPNRNEDEEKLEKALLEAQKESKAQELQKKINEAITLGQKKCFRKAYRILENILIDEPNNINARVALVSILNLDGKFDEAMLHIHYILYIDPRNVNALLLKASILRSKIDYPKSARVFLQALSIEDKNFQVNLGLAYTYVLRNNFYRAKQVVNQMTPKTKEEKEAIKLINKYFSTNNFNFLYYDYRDSEHLNTRKYFGIVTEWGCDSRFDWTYRHVCASQPISDEITINERLESGSIDVMKFLDDIDVAGGIGYAKISEDSRGSFVIGNLRSNVYTNAGVFSLGSLYDIYTETAGALFFKIRTWTNYINYVRTLSGKATVGARYFYTKYSDANHSNRAELFGQYKLFDGCFQLYGTYLASYLHFKSQPISLFPSSIISGGNGYFDPKNALNNQFSLGAYYDKGKKIYVQVLPYFGYLTYHLLGIHYNGTYYILNGFFGYRFNNNIISELTGEAGAYALKHLRYSYSIVTARLKIVF